MKRFDKGMFVGRWLLGRPPKDTEVLTLQSGIKQSRYKVNREMLKNVKPAREGKKEARMCVQGNLLTEQTGKCKHQRESRTLGW